jgi:hypothetical protein
VRRPILTLPSSGRLFGGNAACRALAARSLVWVADPGFGYLQLAGAQPYDESYFAKYEGYAETEIGRRLNAARLALVARHWDGPLVDVGIGCGQFVASRPLALGYDVNPAGIAWLNGRDLWCDPYAQEVRAACFWDSLEHIADPAPLLANIRDIAFVALPIFRDMPHALGSKHFRPDEHAWYFTERGFVAFMDAHGFRLVEVTDDETRIGREDILSFVFRRDR